jgi:N,N'-diacetyllegionaminate synthase
MSRILIIAEIGVNHNGSFEKAKKLINKAKASGADVVKFQYFKTDNLATKNLRLTPYQKKK